MTRVLEECKQLLSLRAIDHQNPDVTFRLRLTFYDSSLFDYNTTSPGVRQSKTAVAVLSDSWIDFLLNFFMSLAIIVTLVYFLPGVLTRYFNVGVSGKSLSAQQVILEDIPTELPLSEPAAEVEPEQINPLVHEVAPHYDLSMPEGRWLISDSAGIRAPLSTNASIQNDSEVSALMENGAYIYPQFNNIGWKGKLTILAGHHYNMAITQEKAQSSFQNLKNLQVGDVVQIADDYKVWNYEIYKIEESKTITEASPDLLVYTCVYWWDSELRLFAYGRIVE